MRYEYRLTERGKALHPVLVSLIAWANDAVPPPEQSSVTLVSRSTGTPVAPVLIDANTGSPITPHTITAQRNEGP